MPGQITSARVAARQRAQAIRVRRQAETAQREEKIFAILTRFYEARDHVTRYQRDAAQAVRELNEMLGTAAETAGLCGISTAAARSMITAAAAAASPAQPGSGPAPEPAARPEPASRPGPDETGESGQGTRHG